MTALSCLLIGLTFLIAVGLLLAGGIGLGWLLQALTTRRKGSRPDRKV